MPSSHRAAGGHRSDRESAPDASVRLQLEAGPRAAAEARSGSGRALREWLLGDDEIAVAQLLVSELVTDAVQRAATALTVDLQRHPDQVRIAVTESSAGGRRLDLTDDADAAARRRLVSMLASRWGRGTEGPEWCTWVELDTQPGRPAATSTSALGAAWGHLLDALLPQRGALANARTAVDLNRRSAVERREVALALILSTDSSPVWGLRAAHPASREERATTGRRGTRRPAPRA